MKKKKTPDINVDSLYSLGTIKADGEEGVQALERAIHRWVCTMEESKHVRALQAFENVSFLLGNHFTSYYYTASDGFGYYHGQLPAGSTPEKVVEETPARRVDVRASSPSSNRTCGFPAYGFPRRSPGEP